MDSLPISLEPRPFQALLNGLIRKTFYQEPDITIEYLAGELYADSELEAAQIVNEISLYEKILLRAGQRNWEVAEMTEFLSERSLPAEHVQVVSAVWKKERSKVRSA